MNILSLSIKSKVKFVKKLTKRKKKNRYKFFCAKIVCTVCDDGNKIQIN